MSIIQKRKLESAPVCTGWLLNITCGFDDCLVIQNTKDRYIVKYRITMSRNMYKCMLPELKRINIMNRLKILS